MAVDTMRYVTDKKYRKKVQKEKHNNRLAELPSGIRHATLALYLEIKNHGDTTLTFRTVVRAINELLVLDRRIEKNVRKR